MWVDAVDLRDFYAGPLGRTARRVLGTHLRTLWPDVSGMSVLGLGFATPYLNVFRAEAERTLAAMPASQGVLHWPSEGAGLTFLTDEAELPLPDLSVDRVLLVHAVECADQLRPMMREIWRVLAGSGRLIIVAPNRAGIWARLDRTPFGFGRPFSSDQLVRLLRDTMFTPIATHGALYVPPARSRMVLSSARAWEKLGRRWFRAVGGVVTVEASKQIYAAPPEPVVVRRRAYAPHPIGTPNPTPTTRSSVLREETDPARPTD
jgi:SAM-dependent methyltransferase